MRAACYCHVRHGYTRFPDGRLWSTPVDRRCWSVGGDSAMVRCKPQKMPAMKAAAHIPELRASTWPDYRRCVSEAVDSLA